MTLLSQDMVHICELDSGKIEYALYGYDIALFSNFQMKKWKTRLKEIKFKVFFKTWTNII